MSDAIKAVKAMMQSAALEHDCPRCKVKAGEPCVSRSRKNPEPAPRKKVHTARCDAAFAAGTIKIGEPRQVAVQESDLAATDESSFRQVVRGDPGGSRSEGMPYRQKENNKSETGLQGGSL